MLDLKTIREDRSGVESALAKRGKSISLDELFRVDEQRRALLLEVEQLKATKNRVSRDIPMIKKQGGDVESLMNEMKDLSGLI